jgi:hypothetical protein
MPAAAAASSSLLPRAGPQALGGIADGWVAGGDRPRAASPAFVASGDGTVEGSVEIDEPGIVAEHGQGVHRSQLEYAKNGSVDSGLDEARILSITARVMGTPFQLGGWRGRPLMSPFRDGPRPIRLYRGWSSPLWCRACIGPRTRWRGPSMGGLGTASTSRLRG